MTRILILGAGGHAKVVADCLLGTNVTVLGFLDDDAALWGQTRLGLPVLGGIETFHSYVAPRLADALIVGIGTNAARRALVERLGEITPLTWGTAIHPRATVAASAQIGPGTMIMAHAVVNADAIVGRHVIINTGAIVEHDCQLGDYAHVAPGANLGGGVQIGEGTLIGVGSSVKPSCAIGQWVTTGAGAVVVRDIPDRVIAVGVPARWDA